MSGLYVPYKQALLGTGTRIDLDADVIKVGLLNIAVDYTFVGDETRTSLTGLTRYAGSTDQILAFTGTTAVVTSGTTVAFDAADAVFTAVAPSGSKTVAALVFYKFVTNDAGSTPLVYIDGFTPITPNTGNVTLQFDAGNNRIFSF